MALELCDAIETQGLYTILGGPAVLGEHLRGPQPPL